MRRLHAKEKAKKVGIVFVLIESVFFIPSSLSAQTPVTFLKVDSVPGAFYGSGYNLTTQQFTAPCVNVNISATYPSGGPEQNSFFDLTENTATIIAQSNTSASMALKALLGGGTLSASSKTSITSGSESSTFSQTLFASVNCYIIPHFLDIGQIAFKPQALQLLTTPGGKCQFAEQCGNAFVLGIQCGR